MRSDKQKLTGKPKEGAKRPQKDLESRRQPKAAAVEKQGQAKNAHGTAHVRWQVEKSGQTLH